MRLLKIYLPQEDPLFQDLASEKMDEENKRQNQERMVSAKMVYCGCGQRWLPRLYCICVRLWMGKKSIAEKFMIRCYKIVIYLSGRRLNEVPTMASNCTEEKSLRQSHQYARNGNLNTSGETRFKKLVLTIEESKLLNMT